MSEVCFSCGGQFDAGPGDSTHAYMASTPGCWDAFGAVLAREYQNTVLFGRCHRLTVDAYSIQHPGNPGERRARQSFWIHGASLWMVLRMGRTHGEATEALKMLAQGDFPVPPPAVGFALTHADVLAAPEVEHERRVWAWAEAALAGCPAAHATFAEMTSRAG